MRNPYNATREAVARSAFTYAGISYAKGQRFPYRELGIVDLDLRGLWVGDRIDFLDQPYVIAAQPATTSPSLKPHAPQPHAKR